MAELPLRILFIKIKIHVLSFLLLIAVVFNIIVKGDFVDRVQLFTAN